VTLPAAIAAEIETQLGQRIAQAAPVSGGCIHTAMRVQTDECTYFVKYGAAEGGAMFETESLALQEIAATQTVRVPEVIARGSRWLLLEWLEPGQPSREAWRAFGEALARMHRVRHDRFGWNRPNFIGSLPQQNDWSASWPRFWQERRLQPQVEPALEHGYLGREDVRKLEQLYGELDERLTIVDQEGASLLHGDLWSGNAHRGAQVIAAVDPSVYHGHREVDLAMAELFGGFPRTFWEGYLAEWPLHSEALEQRRAIYQLYYLLVHLNLFGAGYLAGTRSALLTALK
jgi:fructosamine-3-kinase